MESPLIRYVETADRVKIAYWVIGTGRPVIHLPALPHTHIQLEWETPEWRRGYELGAMFRRVVRYDSRGTGLSQREVNDFALEAHIRDLEAVVDDLGVDQVTLFGVTNTCPVAIAYTVRHPERVSDLVLWIPVVDTSVHRDNPMLAAARQVMEINWEMFSETVAHSLFGWDESEAARRFAALIRAGITQDTIRVLVPAMHEFNVTDLLPQVRCPTLILHRPECGLLPPGSAERVAATIPNAQLALFEGTSTAPFIGDWRSIIRAIGGFLGVAALASPNGVHGGGRALRLLNMRNGSLSPREREIAGYVVRGYTNRQIADELFLAPKTVENHVGRILVKLDLRSRAQLAAYAVEHGLTGHSA
jgi:DNA-binding CsgD family transcriptional regulator/pimeloyl-ACP methyl ester carboxylesterase